MANTMISKGLFFGICLFIVVVAVCFITLVIITIIYGDPKGVTDDPTDPRLERGHANYLEPATYKKYRMVNRSVTYTGFLSVLIGLSLYGIRWYILNQSSD